MGYKDWIFVAVVIFLQKYAFDAQKARPMRDNFLESTTFFDRWYVWCWPYGDRAQSFLKNEAAPILTEYKAKVSRSWIALFVCISIYLFLEYVWK